ncbi:unnamed protein product [Orchesella dallaii]|uniref:Uncharacterized protein n=1 Tax=Orchesella dallaii TaxID=48710 RepID=A0ABP1RFF7_9HEXA
MMNGKSHDDLEGATRDHKKIAEQQQYISNAKKFLAEKGMSSKMDFAELMIHYTFHHSELDWKFEEIGALTVLSDKWKHASESSTIQHYYKMERFHDVLNARFIGKEGQVDRYLAFHWKSYIQRFKEWMETALLHQYKINRFELSESECNK